MFSRRLPHIVTRKDLALLIAPTYATSASIDFEEAHERMERAVTSDRVSDHLYAGLSAALYERKGPRTTEDALVDEVSAGVQKRRFRVKAAALTPALSAVMVMLNVELGYAPEGAARGWTARARDAFAQGAHQVGLSLLPFR